MRDCLQMRPLSTVGDCFAACKRLGLCSGDFVRAEGRSAVSGGGGAVSGGGSGVGVVVGGGDVHSTRPIRKDDPLSASCTILRLQSTKKSQWQQ